jgi:hypothetical protein
MKYMLGYEKHWKFVLGDVPVHSYLSRVLDLSRPAAVAFLFFSEVQFGVYGNVPPYFLT